MANTKVKAEQLEAAQTNITSLGTLTSLTTSGALNVTSADGISDNSYVAVIRNQEATDGRSFGLNLQAGSNATDIAVNVTTHDAGTDLFRIRGDGTAFMGAAGNLLVSANSIATTSGNLTLDVAGDIVLDAGGGDIILKDDGTHWASLYTNGTNTYLQNMISDGDMYFTVNDGGSSVNALIIDGSAAGAATFSAGVTCTTLTPSGRVSFGEHIIGSTATGYLQLTSGSGKAWALSQAGGGSPGTDRNAFGIHHWNASAWSNPFMIASDGKVGIGTTTSPGSALHITTGNSTGEIRLSTSISHSASGGTNNKLSFYNTANSVSEMGSIRGVQHNQYTYGNIDVYLNNANSINHHTRFYYTGAMIVGSTTISHTDEVKNVIFPSGGMYNVYNLSSTNEWWVTNNLASNSGYTTKIDFRTQNTSRGYIGITGSTVNYVGNSDYRLKENYKYDFDATSLIKAMKPLQFTWKEEPMRGTQTGFLAHELKEVCPYVVEGEKDEMRDDGIIRPQGVDQGKLVAVLTKALQEAITRIEALEAK